MRCNNCGWENPDHLTRCEKCNSPLSGGQPSAVSSQPAAAPQSFNKTVNEGAFFPGGPAQSPLGAPLGATVSEAGPEANICPECGYPMRPGVRECPNCHHGAVSTPARPQTAPAPKQVKASPTSGTVNPWIQVAPANECSLEPIAQEGVPNPATVHLKGDAHELNRANLDPDNMTITSKLQACITCEDGQWFIEDKSAQHTTFIYAGEKTALKDGDVILMGNRQFIFHG